MDTEIDYRSETHGFVHVGSVRAMFVTRHIAEGTDNPNDPNEDLIISNANWGKLNARQIAAVVAALQEAFPSRKVVWK